MGHDSAHVTWLGHTIEAILELSARLELGAVDRLRREEGMQGQAEEVVAESGKGSLGVDEAGEASPANLLLELVEIECRGMEQRRRRTAGDVVAEERQGIADQGQEEGDDESTRAERC
jgi:hypothetical protein